MTTATAIDTAPVEEPKSAQRARRAAEYARLRVGQIDRRLVQLADDRRTARMGAARGDSDARERAAALDAEAELLAGRRDVAEADAAAAQRQYERAMAGPDLALEEELRRRRERVAARHASASACLAASGRVETAYTLEAIAEHRLAARLGEVPAAETAPAVVQRHERRRQWADTAVPARIAPHSLQAIVVAASTGPRAS